MPMNSVELASLLCSRLCHDLLSPVGALNNGIELLADEQLAVMQVTKADFERTGTKTPATEDLVNWPMAIGAVELSIFLAENPDSGDGRPTKLSFRSKGRVDVAKLAETFGGGGHPRAAGARIDAPLTEARRRVVEEALKHFPQP